MGGYGFYDIVANKPGVVAVPSIFLKLLSGTYSASGISGNTTTWGFGGEYDYFIVDRIAVLASLEYDSTSSNANSTTTSSTGFNAGTGFKVTF